MLFAQEDKFYQVSSVVSLWMKILGLTNFVISSSILVFGVVILVFIIRVTIGTICIIIVILLRNTFLYLERWFLFL